ncbi:rhodanese-like domain-containing protein [Clostridium vincentii]|uniref:Thiosulfate sulfurtransferase PspE n=1 Tax=Clostridium vincentii TaxID=52704 RepID=A0A2T0BFG9_9CLOT|nr:rhodanese-like domain-containing protein [Clostridium vincentii]PRR82640.1 Thiosulfate sulfurtransferase PspE precursor [Clostridium vincentii]
MKKLGKRAILLIMVLIGMLSLISCGKSEVVTTEKVTVTKISSEDAKKIMDEDKNIVILDVRTEDEYNSGHIENSILISVDDLEDNAEEILKDKDQKILVYCRTGNRSNTAGKTLNEMGYTNVYDFGGINSWKYELVK